MDVATIQAILEAFDKMITTSPGLQISIISIIAGTYYVVPLAIHNLIRGYKLIKKPYDIIAQCRATIQPIYLCEK